MIILENGTITSPRGFSAAGATAGIKQSGKPDIALVVADGDCTAAGVFTRNQVAAAPVLVSRETLRANPAGIRAVVANAGNANACTGKQGLLAARRMQEMTADQIGARPDQILVLSTGVIGVQLPLDKVAEGVASAAAVLSPAGGDAAARAIMTTDTRDKQLAVQIELAGGPVTIGGMAKGSGMIHPDMATMLGVVTTDASISGGALQECLSEATDLSFNRISVDGDTSTNDTVFLLASGAAAQVASDDDLQAFGDALAFVCTQLAQMIVRDGEGATRFVHVHVTGAPDTQAAHTVAQTIATSPLVKTAIAGGDPNWGRILAAAGRAGIALDQDQLSLWVRPLDGAALQLVEAGMPLRFQESDAASLFALPEFVIDLDLGLGTAETTVWTCDLTHDYVTINADYRT